MPHFWSARIPFLLQAQHAKRRIFGQFLILAVSSVRKISAGRIEGISNSDLEFWPCNGPPKFRLLQICEVIICQLICPIISVNMSVRRCVAVFPACQVCEHQMPVENSKVIFGQGLDPKRGWFNHIFDRQVQWFFLVRLSIYDIYIYYLLVNIVLFFLVTPGYRTVMETMVHGKPKKWFLFDFDDFPWFSQ